MIYGFGLVKTLGYTDQSKNGIHQHESAAGLFNLHFEVTGSVGLGGADEGVFHAEGLTGISYGLSSNLDVRVAYEAPLSSPREFDSGLVTGFIWHF